jgi:hypothetical protein
MFDLMRMGEVREFVKNNVLMNKKEVGKMKVLYSSYCSKEKLKNKDWMWGDEERKFKVGDIYLGDRWDWIRDEVERMRLNKEEVFIFSGKYGMINWNMMIEYYDVYFGKDKLDDGKKLVREWCRGMVDKYGKFKLVYWVDESIYKQSKQYVDVMEVVKEYGCELEIREIW